MKDKILNFIQGVKAIFTDRKNAMPNVKFHKPHIEQIANDEKNLEQAYQTIVALDESNPVFIASAFFYLMEMVRPVFRNWLNRNKVISARADVEGHIKANKEFSSQSVLIYRLLTELNSQTTPPLIQLEPNTETPGKAIIRQYDQTRAEFLTQHPIQVVTLSNNTNNKLE